MPSTFATRRDASDVWGLAPAREATTANSTPPVTGSKAAGKAKRRVVNRAAFWVGQYAKATTPKERAETAFLHLKADVVHVARDLDDDVHGSPVWPALQRRLDGIRADLVAHFGFESGDDADRSE
jgi:hypothetical protein